MAWRSGGTTNDEMVDNLKRFGVVSTDIVEQAFRSVDRKYFVPKGHENVAHTDQPLKEGRVHISAPHIYGSALEALELTEDASLSFLNVGSGTGYLSSIVAEILGHRSLNFGIEIYKDVIDHSLAAIEQWKQEREDPRGRALPNMEVIHGNALNISTQSGESVVGFDRIYVGAAVDHSNLSKLTKLLRPGGILVGPVEDELVKVVRIGPADEDGDMTSKAESEAASNDFTQQVLSGVRFAPLLAIPMLKTLIPSRIWAPEVHQLYPDSFRESSKALMLCSTSDFVQPPPKPQKPENRTNLAAMLPPVLWMEILSFTHRNWFEPPQQETAFLRKRLLDEQASTQKANQARLDAEAKCLMLERERDVYRLMARRWQSRLQSALAQRTGSTPTASNEEQEETEEEEGTMTLALTGSETAAIFGLGNMLRRLHDGGDDDDEEDDEEHEEMEVDHRNESMDEDMDHDAHGADQGSNVMLDDSDDESFSSEMEEGESHGIENVAEVSMSPTASKDLAAGPKVRAVSLSNDSL